MSDSTWQQAVLRDLGVSQRGLQVLASVPSSPAQPVWGAEAPPRPVPEQQAPAIPVMPDPQPVAVAPQVPVAPPTVSEMPAPAPEMPPPPPTVSEMPPPPPSVSEMPPPPPSVSEMPPPPVLEPPPPRPPLPEMPPPAPFSPRGNEDAPVPRPEIAEQEAPEPPVEFDWAAAVNPLIGVDTSEAPLAEQAPAQPMAPQHADPAPPAHGPAGAVQEPPAAEDLVRKNQHGDPLGRRVGRSVRKAVGGGSREARDMAVFVDLMRRSVPSTRQIAIASVRGGAGKTTMAALVATELARHRGDRVLAADADAELGSLPLRLGVRPQLSLFDLAGQNPRSFEEAARFLAHTPQGLFVLSSTRGGRIAGEFTLEMFQNALSQVARYVGTTIVDCGAGILTELNRGVVASSHGLVLVTPGTVDGALSARGAMEWYANNDQRGILGRTVIAMVSHAPQVGADLQRAHQMLSAWGLPVVLVPYDRHLATGGSLDMTKISADARAAVIRIVHEVFARALSAGNSG